MFSLPKNNVSVVKDVILQSNCCGVPMRKTLGEGDPPGRPGRPASEGGRRRQSVGGWNKYKNPAASGFVVEEISNLFFLNVL